MVGLGSMIHIDEKQDTDSVVTNNTEDVSDIANNMNGEIDITDAILDGKK